MNEYFYIDNQTKQQCGPFSIESLKSKNIQANTMVWAAGMADWTEAKNVSELSVLFVSAPINNSQQQYTTNPRPQQQRPMYSHRQMGGVNEVRPIPKTWLVESILVTIFCCIPFGIAAILSASKVESLYYAGDYESAEKASKDAKKWTMVSFFSLFIGIALYLLFYFVLIVGIMGLSSLDQL